MISNCWGAAPLKRIKTEHFSIFRGVPGAAYNHHQVISLNGRLYVSWSNGI